MHVRLLTARLLAGQGENLGQGVVRGGGALGEGREELSEADPSTRSTATQSSAKEVGAVVSASSWLRAVSVDVSPVIFRQAPGELVLVGELCQLSDRETAIVASLPKGSALWKVGQRSFQVEHCLSAWEREITYTDERMALG